MTDAMTFVLTGEEVQLGDTVNKTTPTKLVFTPVPDADRAARLAELREAGLNVPDSVTMTQAEVDLAQSFKVGTTSVAGSEMSLTYDHLDYDTVSGEHSFECSISPDGTIKDEETGAILPGSIEDRLSNGANVFGNCLIESAVSEVTEEVDELVTTAMGDLKKTVYGALYEVLGVNGNRTMGQRLLGLGLDCFIVGAVATTTDGGTGLTKLGPEQFDTSFPTSDDILEGAADVGDNFATDALSQSSPTTITKLSGSSTGSTSFFGDLI